MLVSSSDHCHEEQLQQLDVSLLNYVQQKQLGWLR
jgi:hypothetical protein